MREAPRTILSASRRTDIPAFYMDGFMDGVAKGCFEVVNPYNQHRRRIPARPQEVRLEGRSARHMVGQAS